jgi:hypothetical protein
MQLAQACREPAARTVLESFPETREESPDAHTDRRR